MAIQKLNIEDFLELAKDHPVIDVRSPGEYLHAHIPNAHSLPLFTDEERKLVGTAYKQESRERAIKMGLDFFGKKMVTMVESVEKLMNNKNAGFKTVLVHCWRGGMRSAGVAWLLDLYGFKVYTLVGGYKVFRNWVLDECGKDYPFTVIGGYTGSGKTLVLHQLKKQNQAVLDLEGLAHHKGSAFGNIGLPPQPSQEMFENKLALELKRCTDKISSTGNEIIWLEDESQRIGNVNIPMTLWKLIRKKHVVFIDIPFEQRLTFIESDYGKGDKEKLIAAIIRIQKRLGGLETKTAINYLLEDNVKESFRILLKYYDKLYSKGMQNRDNWQSLITELVCERVDAIQNARKVLESKTQKENA
jgi:tRNA 2-selenouridine synthase